MTDSEQHSVELPPDCGDVLEGYFEPRADGVNFPKADLDGTIPQRFEKIARLYPNRTAVKFGERSLTYEELNQAANRIAHEILEQRGQGSEPIALFLDPGVDVLAAIFGVLKAGKFYVALDCASPLARIDYVMKDAGAKVLLTHSANRELARGLNPGDVTVLNIDEIKGTARWDESLLRISPDDFAALMYTSGSEGLPKGLVESHRFMLHSARGITYLKRITPSDRLTLFHFVGFAAAEAHLFASLLNGACLCPFDIKSRGVQPLISWLEAEGISLGHMPVSAFRQLAELIPRGTKFSQLRLMQLSGAPITRSDFDLYRAKFSPAISLQILMGTTEAGAVATGVINHDFSFPKTGTPIGYAWPDKQLQLLDESGVEVVPGAVGEICVRSRYMSAGYWRRGGISQGEFLADHGGGDERIYRTGDLGRMMPNGFFIHMGRKDLRVKIRGFRIEIGEIERVLLSHPVIKDVAVRAWERESGENYLAGYFVAGGQVTLTVSELVEFLRMRLPDYMIPAAFVVMDSLPLTNGKIDRNSLPTPARARPNLNHPYIASRNTIESDIIRIWEELLDICPIGVHDNFFELGGDSLLVSRFVARLCDVFRLELALDAVFVHPTPATLAGRIESALREHRVRKIPAIVPSSRGVNLPLSFSQQRLWFLDQLEPGSCAYNLLFSFQLTGQLNMAALAEAVNAIIARHEALRTVFKQVNGQPYQIILPSMKIDLSLVELRGITSQAEQEAEARRLCTSESQRPFDLTRGPLIRTTLLQLTDDRYVLGLVVHHIVFDGWSIGILTRELSAYYKQFCQGKPAALGQLGIQYPDFAVWQRQWFRGELLAEELSYWKRKLGQSPPLLEVPKDNPRPRVQSYRGAQKVFALTGKLLARLKSLGKESGSTLFMVLLAAYQTLLQRYTGQNDIVVGSPVAGRNRQEIEGLVGFFLNMLVLRTDLSANPTFRQLLARVREVCLEAYAHQDLPFEKIVEELRPDRDLSRNPFFQVTFALQNTPLVPLDLTGLRTEELDFDSGIAIFDLHLYMVEENNRLRGWLSYNGDMFNDATIARMVHHFQVLLESIVADPERRISDLALQTDVEMRQLLVEWNDTKTAYPKDKCIHQLFEKQAEKDPDATAVVFNDQQLNYRELNNRANRLAHYLQKLGVGANVLVGICLERSLEMVVAVLGVLKAGGAYLPIDPEFPRGRIEFMLQDSRSAFMLTEARIEDLMPSFAGTRISLDREWDGIARESASNVGQQQSPDSLAYVIYTSGSTGQPKGVMIQHRSVVNFLVSMAREPGVTERDILLAVTSLSFDIAGLEIFLPLTSGARVVLACREVAVDGIRLAGQLSECGATVMQATPATWRMLLAAGWQGSRELKILCGGEALAEDLAKLLVDRCGSLWNMYGPTETTIWSSIYKVPADVGRVTLGRPIANTQIYILDNNLQPVPIGIPGEMYIGGDGLAQGYLNHSDLTGANFIANPFSADFPSRLYKTGDLGRYLSGGRIEFLGRLDDQVKIRGFRIELGEIEATLAQHPSIKESVVFAREDTPGDRRLVAYVIVAPGADPSTNELRSFLHQRLPDYMLPSVFMFLESLPLSPNGKVDRGALPNPGSLGPELQGRYVAPCTPLETALVRIWANLLKLDQVGTHDNFFELGGHSLLATQAVSRFRETFGLEVPLRLMFESPTVAELAVKIAQAQAKRVASETMTEMLAELESLPDE